MKWTLIAVALLAFQDTPKMADNTEAMKKLEWIAGKWSGTGDMANVGKVTDNVSFEWTLKKNFLKVDQTIQSGKMTLWHSTGLLGWDTKKKQFVWFQFGLDGRIGWTRTDGDVKKDIIVLDGQLTGGGPFASFRTTFKKTGEKTMSNKLEFKSDKGLSTFTETDYKKVEKTPEGEAVKFKDGGRLKKYEWLSGTWVGGGEMEGFGKFTDEYKLEWSMGRNFIRNSYWMRVDGKVLWHDTGMIGYDADKKKYIGANFGIDGTIGWGEEIESEGEGTFAWEGETVGPTENIKFRATIRKVDADTMKLKVEQKDGEKWVEYAPEQTRKRKKK